MGTDDDKKDDAGSAKGEESPPEEKEEQSSKRTPTNRRRQTSAPNQITFKGATSALKEHVFVHSDTLSKRWMTSRQEFINCASRTHGGDVEASLENRKITVITVVEPTMPSKAEMDAADEYEREFLKDNCKTDRRAHKEAITKTKKDMTKLCKALWGQCDPLMQNEIKAHKDCAKAHGEKSSVESLMILEAICEKGNTSTNPRVQRFHAMKKLSNCIQADGVDLGECPCRFETLANTGTKMGLTYYQLEDLEDAFNNTDADTEGKPFEEFNFLSDEKREKIKEEANQRVLAIIFTMNSNNRKHAVYKVDLQNGREKYPTTALEAHAKLEDFVFNPRHHQVGNQGRGRPTFTAHQFANDGDDKSKTNNKWKPSTDTWQCHNCDRWNECWAGNCPHKTKENGEPTRDERRRMCRSSTNQQVEGEQHFMHGVIAEEEAEIAETEHSEEDDTWADELDGNDYEVTFFNDAVPNREVLVEDSRGNNKHAFNNTKRRLSPTWILMDNQSSVNVFCNKRFLRNVRQASKVLILHTNAGRAIITMVGDLPGFGETHHYPAGIANILSFHKVTNMPGYGVLYDNRREDAFVVTNPRGETRKFIPSRKGLYYWDAGQAIQGATFAQATTKMVAVANNKSKFSHRDTTRATKARSLQDITNWSDKDMMMMAKYGTPLNSPFAPRDIKVMTAMLGPSVRGLQGKSTRRRREEVPTALAGVPPHVMEHHRMTILSIDVMHVNKIPFLVTTSKHIHCGTASPLEDMTAPRLYDTLKQLSGFYNKRGFKIDIILADEQFECLESDLANIHITLNIAGKEEHVPEAERFIRVIKERCRCAMNATPFKQIPKRMILGVVAHAVLCTNAIPWVRGVSLTLSPLTITTGKKMDCEPHCNVPFGACAQVRRSTDNTMKKRTVGAMALGTNMNLQGGVAFMSLRTGRKLDGDAPDFTILPMPDEVIERANEMGKSNGEGLIFTDKDGIEMEEDADSVMADDEPPAEEQDPEQHELSDSDDERAVDDDTTSYESTGADNDQSTGANDDRSIDDDTIIFEEESSESDESDGPTNDTSDEDEDEEVGVRTRSRSGWTATPTTHAGFEDACANLMKVDAHQSDIMEGHQHFQGLFNDGQAISDEIESIKSGIEQHNCEKALSFLNDANEETINRVSQMAMTQCGLKAGLRECGEEGRVAATKELKQMLAREAFEEINYESLTSRDKKLALPTLLFLTRKRDGSVKGRACADGRKQRTWMNKEDTRSPTVTIEGLFCMMMIDAFEGREIATLDLPGHFPQTPMDERLMSRTDGELADALVRTDPRRWKKHAQKVRGKPVIFARCSEATYGTLNAASLSHRKLTDHLTEWEHEVNPCDPCAWNKVIDGSQMTVAFHVDDMWTSHKSKSAINGLVNKPKGMHGKTDPMTVVHGKAHEYLGMTVDMTNDNEAWITMHDCVQKLMNSSPETMKGKKAAAAPTSLFKTNDDDPEREVLNDEDKDAFHAMTAQPLCLGKRARPDLQTAVSFLCTRVRSPDTEDWSKLTHLVQHLQATKHSPLIVRYGNKEASLHIDGAHAVHADMKGHIGAMATAGKGTICASSTKMKSNALSSAETELVSVGEKLPKHTWFRYFRMAQGSTADAEDVLYQDNEAATLLENNGRPSCGKGSKHAHIRFFFTKDRIDRKEISVRHCPTSQLIADYFTKPLQGNLFRKFRDLILGIDDNDTQRCIMAYREALERFGLNDTV